jgi:radical SAM protein (TIGR01212 family)
MDSFSRMQSCQDIDVATQIADGIQVGMERKGIHKFIVYFQSSTNTYAPVEILKELFENALTFPGVVGLSVSTRPDCLDQPVLSLLSDLSARTDLWVELGLQSMHDETLRLINRGHSFRDYTDAVASLSQMPLRICTHLMLGLPGETDEMMRQTALAMAQSPIHEIKLHPLLILQETRLAELFHQGLVQSLSLSAYASLVVDFIERMPQHMVMQRLTAEAPREMLLAPLWALDKHAVRRAIEAELVGRDTWQGKRVS